MAGTRPHTRTAPSVCVPRYVATYYHVGLATHSRASPSVTVTHSLTVSRTPTRSVRTQSHETRNSDMTE